MRKLLAVVFLFCLLPSICLAQTPAGRTSGRLDFDYPKTVGLDFVWQNIKLNDKLGDFYMKTKQPALGARVVADLPVPVFGQPINFGYNGQFAVGTKEVKITTNAETLKREENATSQIHKAYAQYMFMPEFRLGAVAALANYNRAPEIGAITRWDDRWTALGIRASGEINYDQPWSFDYSAEVMKGRMKEVTDIKATSIISGVPVAQHITNTRWNDALAFGVGGGVTYWPWDNWGFRGGVDFFNPRSDVKNVPGRKLDHQFISFSGGIRYSR